MSERSGIAAARMWLLLLLDGIERIGISPLSAERLHRLVYLANAMAPVYDLLTPDGYILKYKRGPFFPTVQWDVDRLSAQGLVRSSDMIHFEDELGWWFDANYSLTVAGRDAVDVALKLEEVIKKAAFLREVVRAFAAVVRTDGLSEYDANNTLLEDVGYERADIQGPVDFRLVANNLTAQAASGIGRALAVKEAVPRRAELHMYFRYLERAWTLRAESARG